MLTNTMEAAECSLDEFARALAANGYINDDSCFAGTDLPTMLSAFETVGDLASPDSFPDSPYSNEELSRVLEMAQITAPSLLDSCLQDNFAHSKPPSVISAIHDIDPCKTRDPCITNAVLNESLQNLSAALASKHNNRPSNYNAPDAVSLNFNLPDAKENDILDNSSFHCDSLLPQSSEFSPYDLGNNSATYSKSLPYANHINNDTLQATSLQHQMPGYLTSSTESVGTSTELESSEAPAPITKQQRRKRKSKGYTKPAKSRKKKAKTNAEPKQQQPKPKKPKIAKTTSKNDTSNSKLGLSSFSDNVDVPQEDSGFESGDKTTTENASSSSKKTNSSSSAAPSSSSDQEEPRGLRRSSRTTRNTENYNFRLSSLVKRVETERRQQEPRQPKDKIKPPPLSKYRRRTANARERDRMKEINDAFDKLKGSLPEVHRDDGKQKITKFTILKHALNYIASLRDMLGYEPLPSSLDDDASSDLSSIRPASVTSSGGEDSCSSPTSSGRSGGDGPSRNNDDHVPSSFMSKQVPSPDMVMDTTDHVSLNV